MRNNDTMNETLETLETINKKESIEMKLLKKIENIEKIMGKNFNFKCFIRTKRKKNRRFN
jgi:hypothetical protein